MSTGFSFGQKPNETPTFGQTSFGSPAFGAPTSTATTTSQFSSTFGAKQPSSGFQFSTPVSSSAFGTTFNFNSPTQQPNTTAPSYGFGSAPAYSFGPTGATTTLPTGLSFSNPTTAQALPLFGAPQTTAATSGFSTGVTKPTAPFGSTIPSGGLFAMPNAALAQTPSSFGAQLTSAGSATTSGFSMTKPMTQSGSTIPSTGLFAMPNAAPAQTTAVNVATPSTQMTTGISFGTAQPTVTKLPFGAPGPGLFGTPATTATSGLSFGPTPTSTPKFSYGPTTTSAPLSFGASQLPTSSSGLNFATPASVPQPILSFTPTTSNVAGTGLSFAVPATSAPLSGFSLPPPASTAPPILGTTFALPTSSAISTGLNFSTPASSAAATTLNFGTTCQSSTAPTAPTLSFAPSALPAASTGFAATTTSTPTVLNFGTPITSASANATTTSAPFGLGGITIKTTTTANTSPGFGLGLQPPTGPSRTVGLGGVTSTPPKQTATTTTGQTEIAPKDQSLPNEILQTVEQFKKFVQEQKNFSSEIARFSIKDLRKVETDVDLVNNCMHEVENQLWKNKALAEKLKLDCAKDLQHMEMAQRTFDTPVGLQYENTAPFNYFVDLSDTFEKEMYELKARIENVNKHVRNSTNPGILSSQDLSLGLRRLHETFVTLAGRLQSVHSQVELQKEQYLNVRRLMLNDYTNVFEEQNKGSEAIETVLAKLGKSSHVNGSPTPFNSLRNSQVQSLAQNTTTPYPIAAPLGAPITTGFNAGPSTTMPLFGSNPTSTPSMFNQSTSNAFQLQKPPVGNKRGKQ